jgi:capsular polysaccharide biosynthesis protein
VRCDDEVFEKIYLMRPRGLFRPLQNEKRVLSGLTTMGFKVISPERLDFHEVLKYMTNARIIVAESGAALTNILFALPGAKIIELYPGKGPMTFWPELAEIAGAEVRKIMSLPCPIGPRGLARDGIYIPFRKLKRTLEEWAI